MIGLCSKTYIVVKKKTVMPATTLLTAARLLLKAKKLKSKPLRLVPKTFWEKKK
jgi:hypothetical protein